MHILLRAGHAGVPGIGHRRTVEFAGGVCQVAQPARNGSGGNPRDEVARIRISNTLRESQMATAVIPVRERELYKY